MSTENVYDLCVIGGGMFGSAAARHASTSSRLKICLIDPGEPTADEFRKREIFGAHYDEGRIVRNLDDHPSRIVLCRNSINRFREMEKQSGVNFYNPLGCLFISEKDNQFLWDIVDAAKLSNAPLREISSKEELQKNFPFLTLKEDENSLLDEHGAGHISPRSLVFSQKKLARLHGCHVMDDVANRVRTLCDGSYEVETAKSGHIKAKRLLVSTGAFVNLKPIDALEPIAVKRYTVTCVLLNIPEEEAKRLRTMPSIIRKRKEMGVYILPPIKYPDGKYYLKFGKSIESDRTLNTLEEMKEWYSSEGDKTTIDTHLSFVTEIIPGLKITETKTFTCVTCYTPTGFPYIDQVSPTLTVALVGNGRGAKFSDEVGRIAANLSTTGTWTSELEKDQFKIIFQRTVSRRN